MGFVVGIVLALVIVANWDTIRAHLKAAWQMLVDRFIHR